MIEILVVHLALGNPEQSQDLLCGIGAFYALAESILALLVAPRLCQLISFTEGKGTTGGMSSPKRFSDRGDRPW
ncbi:hypothetical protein [Picosynechococcus sp. PCC 7117]|uniref:hypothetical protein n=1 Tax=Picosynechococcus sp. PCC 7117 TaxID=195498 RepID=UPI0008106BEE|nr:hypothetical protein [Picosynechococcus sp. PCC 7117]ANV88855.1 hypothetical protein AWQ22_14695 [Picosynechococcus sp. PCC 7117]